MTRVNSGRKQLAYPPEQTTIKRQGTEYPTLDYLLGQHKHLADSASVQ